MKNAAPTIGMFLAGFILGSIFAVVVLFAFPPSLPAGNPTLNPLAGSGFFHSCSRAESRRNGQRTLVLGNAPARIFTRT